MDLEHKSDPVDLSFGTFQWLPDEPSIKSTLLSLPSRKTLWEQSLHVRIASTPTGPSSRSA